jgi:8-oxo-dGTP pyrophosphatase MutT (NUDIX family)
VTHISQRRPAFETPWFVVQEKFVTGEDAPYYSLQMNDYVAVFATTDTGDVILVRQFRPAAECLLLELPAGHVEVGESPEQAARRELREETGFEAQAMTLIGELVPDSGRLANRQWCFFAPGAIRVSMDREAGVEVVEVRPRTLFESIHSAEFRHALHLAVVFMATLRGNWQPEL